MSLSCVVVEYPCLASPGPSRTILSRVFSRVCWGFCLQGLVSIASIELLPAFLPELLQQHGACCIVLYYGVG